jgi:hypothetical protein
MTAPAGLSRRRRRGVQAITVAFDPLQLFANGEPGAWYDPSDVTTMFQDSAGTTPVTTLGQPVGRILDKSGLGNHAIQPTSASRPLWDARINVLLGTTTLATQSVTVSAVSYVLSFSGTGTVTLSGASTAGPLVGTGVGQRVSLTFTPTAGTLTLTVSGTVTDADLRFSSNAAYAYQRVTTATDYADVSAPRMLLFDGVDDSLYTAASVNLSTTDKLTLWAGVYKNSDAAIGVILELTTAATANAFFLAHSLTGPTRRFAFLSAGTSSALVGSSAAAYAAPVSAVATGIGNISAPNCVLRLNGVQDAASTASQGTGNYSNAVLYIGRRNNATLPFNGKLGQCIIRGAATDAGTISAAELYVAQRTGVTL